MFVEPLFRFPGSPFVKRGTNERYSAVRRERPAAAASGAVRSGEIISSHERCTVEMRQCTGKTCPWEGASSPFFCFVFFFVHERERKRGTFKIVRGINAKHHRALALGC